MDNSTDALIAELKNLNGNLENALQSEKTRSTAVSPVSTLSPNTTTPTISTIPIIPLTENNLDEFIFENSQKLVQNSLIAVNDLKDLIGKTYDSKLITSYAELVKATTGVIDTLNSIKLEKTKQTTAKELKTMDIESRKQLKNKEQKENSKLLIATREDIVKMLDDASKEQKIIQIPETDIKISDS